MDRRHFLASASSAAATVLAGCAGGDGPITGGANGSGDGGSNGSDGGTGDEPDVPAVWSDLQELPAVEDLLDQHEQRLEGGSFASEEYRYNPSIGADVPAEIERTVRSDGDRTLLEGTVRPRRGTEGQMWHVEHRRVEHLPEQHPAVRHVHYPRGGGAVTLLERSSVRELVEVLAYERVDAPDDVYAFEATGLSEEAQADVDEEPESIDARVEVHAAGYLRSMDVELRASGDQESAVYQYGVDEFGGVSVSEPSFVDEARRVHGELADDRSFLRLEHVEGPSVPADSPVLVEDATGTGFREGSYDEYPRLPEALEPGDAAFAYWAGERTVEISVGEEPSSVHRALDPGDGALVAESFSHGFAVRFE